MRSGERDRPNRDTTMPPAANLAVHDSGATSTPPPASVGPSKPVNTYGQILRSSAVIGGSSALNMVVAILRTKAMAMMLGPSGFGLMGALTTISDLTRGLAEMGVNNSGVRQIAEAAGSGNTHRIALTVTLLRRITLVLGVSGTMLLAAFAPQVAIATFGNDDHSRAIALLSFAVFFRLVADSQCALLQGMRRIGDIARLGMYGALLGSAISVALVYWLREDGVALSIVALAAASCFFSWWYSRKVKVPPVSMSLPEVRHEVSALLRLGLAFMASALLTLGAAYVVRLMLIRDEGLPAAGLYQAAWTVGGMYVTFVLQAMGADFYPRLVAAANDNAACNRLVNEQTHVSLLLAGIGVIATLTFAPWIVTLLYSSDFAGATETLRWVCLGMALRVITWPLGYILVAKGRSAFFIGTDMAWAIVNVGLTWLCIQWLGLSGAGVAFFASYVFHLAVVYPLSRRLSGFRWSAVNQRAIVIFAGSVLAVQAAFSVLNAAAALAVGTLAVVGSAAYALHSLRALTSTTLVPKRLSWLLRRSTRSQGSKEAPDRP